MAWEGSTRRSRLPPGWSTRIVPAVLARDNGICHVCGKGGADQVDHIQAGDDHRLENLGAIHERPCHRVKSSREGNAARHQFRQARPTEAHPGLL